MRALVFKAILVLSAASFLGGCNSDGSGTVAGVNGSCTPVGSAAVAAHAMTPNMAMQLSSSIPASVSRFADQGKVAEDQPLPITVALNINNEDELDQQIAEIYQPGNPNFHKFISTEEFKARYAPTQDQINQARNFLNSQGIQVTETNENGYMIHAVGTVGTLNQAFSTEIHQYKDSDGNDYFAPAYEPQMPEGISIRAVHGLHNVAQFRSHAIAQVAGAERANSGTGPNGNFSPSDIKGAYSVPTSVNGSGQIVAVAELDGYSASDITTYENQFGISPVSLTNVLIDGMSGSAGSGADEVTLDIELVTAIAPGSSIMVYEAPNSEQGVLDLYARIANDNKAKQVSTSWGAPEGDSTPTFLETENVTFKQMAVQGQTMYAATGDDGAYATGSTANGLTVGDPASQPYVVAVGGTHLNANGGTYESESSWNNGSPTNGAGGGGVSAVWAQPSWQSGVATGQNGASGSMRNVPDVSLNADPNVGYAIYFQGRWVAFGGTSCAAPLWAAYTALVNQKRASNGLASLGFANPYFYEIGKGNRYSSDFHDVNNGSTNLYYPAVSGYDDSTGWGSFSGTNLFDDLSTDQLDPTTQLSC